jgi:hypothetical protein
MHASGVEHAGIVYCATGSLSIGEMIRGLSLILKIHDHNDTCGMLEFLESKSTAGFNPLASRAARALS